MLRLQRPTSILKTTSNAGFRAAIAALLLLATLLSQRQAAAQNRLSVNAEAVFPTSESEELGNGWGVGARFGHEWDLVLIALTPELGVNYHAFGGSPDAEAFAFVAGGRVGIDFVLAPSAFLHAGVGHFGYDTLVGEVSRTSLAYEAGLALDFTLLPVIDIGAHGTFAGVAGDDNVEPLSWFAVGGHVTFVFGGDKD